MSEETNNRIDANPTKEFFISMLTRDIDVKAAILELIDNSIDGARKLRKDNDYTNLYIKINLDADKFIIEDNCGGITIEEAQNYAFRFGRDTNKPNDKIGEFTGVFGIGMKRSLFRMGKVFTVESFTETESFSMRVDVDEWVSNTEKDWTFRFDAINRDQKNTIENCGTKIVVTDLCKGIAETFALNYFINGLRNHIEQFKTMFAENGLKIFVNEVEIAFISDSIINSPILTPYAKKYRVGDVSLKIIAGAVKKGEPSQAGWYIYCNGRLVIFADKSQLTGWGLDGVKQYHPSLAFFRGYVFYESNNLDELPWNTTKTGIDTSSQYYIAALSKMKEATLQIQQFYNYLSN